MNLPNRTPLGRVTLDHLATTKHTRPVARVIKQWPSQSYTKRASAAAVVFHHTLLQQTRYQGLDFLILTVMKPAPNCRPIVWTDFGSDRRAFIGSWIRAWTERDVDIIPVEFGVVAIDRFTSRRSAIGELAVFCVGVVSVEDVGIERNQAALAEGFSANLDQVSQTSSVFGILPL